MGGSAGWFDLRDGTRAHAIIRWNPNRPLFTDRLVLKSARILFVAPLMLRRVVVELDGSVIVVTGSATGLGAAVARRASAKGARVVVNYTKSETEARETVRACEDLGGEALLCQGDVAVDEDCRRIAAMAMDRWGRVDGLVNNAGQSVFASAADLESLSGDDFLRIYSVNVVGAYQMVRAVAPHLKAGGRRRHR